MSLLIYSLKLFQYIFANVEYNKNLGLVIWQKYVCRYNVVQILNLSYLAGFWGGITGQFWVYGHQKLS